MPILSVPAPNVNPRPCGCTWDEDDLNVCQACWEAMTPEAAPAASEPLTPCEDCGKPLWMHFDFQSGESIYYCPDCTHWEPAA